MESILKERQSRSRENFFDIRINSVTPNVPLVYDLFLFVNETPILFRKIGDTITEERIKLLYHHGGNTFLIRKDQKELYLKSLRQMIDNPSSDKKTKAKFIKETALLHVHDLFTNKNIAPIVDEASVLIERMVKFISDDLEAVASLMNLSRHDYYTYNHCVDVAVYSVAIGKRVLDGNNQELLLKIGLGGLLHDIGKRQIDWNLINKKEPLTSVEWEEMKKHPTYGMECLESVPNVSDSSRLIVYEHHENFDGTGYPNKLAGEDISLLSRIVTIADVFDALTTNRAYHKAMSPKMALDLMYGMQPGKFDPNLFKSFNINTNSKIKEEFSPTFDPCHPQSTLQMFKK